MSTEETVCPAHSGLINEIENLRESDMKQWMAIEKLQNRLPVWATLVFSLLTFFLGLSVGFITIKGQ